MRRPADAWPAGHASTSRDHQKEPRRRPGGVLSGDSTRRPSARCAVVSGTARVIRGERDPLRESPEPREDATIPCMPGEFTRADVDRIARLARLELTEDEKALLTPQLSSFLAYAEQVQQRGDDRRAADVASARKLGAWREDAPQPSSDRGRGPRPGAGSRPSNAGSSKSHECSVTTVESRARARSDAMRNGQTSAVDVCRAALDRIRAGNELNCAFTPSPASRRSRGSRARRRPNEWATPAACSACPSR